MNKAEFYAATVRKHREARVVSLALARIKRAMKLTAGNPAAGKHINKAIQSLAAVATASPTNRVAEARRSHREMLANLRVLKRLTEQ